MDQVTQQNAAMVEQTTAAAMSLKTETDQLAQLVERFDTGDAPVKTQVHHLTQASGPVPLARERARIRAYASGGAATAVSQEWEEF